MQRRDAVSRTSEPAFFAEVRVGPKVKHTRLLKGMTLRQLAGAAGCSESLLSKIENSRANPSLNMIHRIASALGMPVVGLMQQTMDAQSVVMRHGDRPIIETDQVRRGKGIVLEAVIPSVGGNLLSGYINHIDLGGGTEGEIHHEGEEFGYVLEGRIEIRVDGHRYEIGAGDCFHFRSERAHSYRNTGVSVARVLWINTPPTF